MNHLARQRKCRHCGARFTPANTFQVACSVACAIEVGKRAQRREARQRLAAGRRRLMTRSDWLRKAQAAFNAWIRARDSHLPCISCGRFHNGQWHAGHYRTTKACPELRFHPDNVHKQCQPCNTHLSGNVVEYRIRLVERIGLDRVEWLEGHHQPQKWTAEQLQAMAKTYAANARELNTARLRMAA